MRHYSGAPDDEGLALSSVAEFACCALRVLWGGSGAGTREDATVGAIGRTTGARCICCLACNCWCTAKHSSRNVGHLWQVRKRFRFGSCDLEPTWGTRRERDTLLLTFGNINLSAIVSKIRFLQTV